MDKEKILDTINDSIVEASQDKLASADFQKALHLNNPKKGVLDAIQERLISRKLLVFICDVNLPL